MLRRSNRKCKPKETATFNSLPEPPSKRKRYYNCKVSDDESLPEDDSSGDEFEPTQSAKVRGSCTLNSKVSDNESLPEDDSTGDKFKPTQSAKVKESCTLNLSESESDSDKDGENFNKPTAKRLQQSDNCESEDEDKICTTNFDFTAILEPQKTSKHTESDVDSKEVDNVEQKGQYDNMDVAKVLSMGEGVNLRTVLNDSDNVDEEKSKRDDNYTIPDMVEISVKLPKDIKCKKGQDMQNLLRRRMNMICKDTQVLIHKVNLLLWITYGNNLNHVLNSPEVMASALSLIPSEKAYPPKQCDLNYLENYIKWFSKKIKITSKIDPLNEITAVSLVEQFSIRTAKTRYDLIAMFISMLRSLGLNVRLVINLNAISIKPNSEQLLGIIKEEESIKPSTSKSKEEIKQVTSKKSEYFNKKSNKTELKNPKKNSEKKKSNNTRSKKNEKIDDDIYLTDEEDDVFVESNKKRKSAYFNKKSSKSKASLKESDLKKSKSSNENKNKKPNISNKIDRRVLSTDEEDNTSVAPSESIAKKKVKNDFWAEVFLEMEEKWFCVDVIGQRLHCIKEIYNGASHPMRYVLAWYNNNSIKDITVRYDPYFHTQTRKIRVDPKWWKATLRPYAPKQSAREREENEELDKQLEEKPLPKTVSEYKNHPLYALSRHLLKFQAIYPPDPPVVGYVRNEPIYLRDYVHELNGRDNWLKEARVVKINEKSYKQVKARPRFDRNGVRTDPPPLELFGFWQTEPYDPPTATDGKVPRNCYGNVDLFKPCMIPKGTVHLKLPGLLRVAKKLNIDCAPAVVGFDFHSGGSHPVNDGFVVCKEFKDTLVDAWNQEVEESRKREQKRYEDRVYGNWKRLVKALLIRERLKIKYNYFNSDKNQSTSKVADKKL